MKSAIVLGAGMVGVSSALALQDRGWSVTLIDRKQPGLETSYGNAGIIQSEVVEPYAMPRSIRELADIVLGRTNDVHYSFRELPAHLGSLARYWWHSQSRRHQAISLTWAGLIAHAASGHEDLIKRANAGNLIRRSGYRVLYRSKPALEEAITHAEQLASAHALDFRTLTPDEVAAAEPALILGGVGAIHWLGPWSSSDPGKLASSYADLFVGAGGTFVHGKAETLKRNASGRGWVVQTESGPIEAENVVVALGPWSPTLLRLFGHRFSMVRKRGYHAHYSSPEPLRVPMMDVANGYVMAPMALGTRVTTGAHLARPDTSADPVQLARAEISARQLMALGERVEEQPWMGTRPCMPDMLPVIGQSQRQAGLWMNFGHGHQGLTLGPVTGELLASVMSGQSTVVDSGPFRPGRY
ncbi:FAD-binding oxidoreductase [Rhizobium sp. KVB221]|uniref:FAD-binding oxidoreductase n=1 Tax=Rhizobium setariae TaxID=2801340 RepID=A0A937CK95_9HYPH|nr:FAD-binding oxidoreductase [Rhizobium setariae]MBL0371915.1 FAD-binding oxidoreductase [Rhizobium setariae]